MKFYMKFEAPLKSKLIFTDKNIIILVLCGSKQFPVRDPFFKMINRSLNNFMNAMTGTDYTMYPFATTNQKDFDNLLRVYLDAVFQPNLRYLDFLQEAWRLGEG